MTKSNNTPNEVEPAEAAETGKPQRHRDSLDNEKPYCWQSKTTLRYILDSSIARAKMERALIAYFTLTWFASDYANHEFQVGHEAICKRCGLSRNTLKEAIKDLEGIGVIDVKRARKKGGKEWQAHTYKLVSSRFHTVGQNLTPSDSNPVNQNANSLANIERPDVEKNTPHPRSQKKDAATSSRSALAGTGRSAAVLAQLKALPDDQRTVVATIYKEQARKDRAEAESERFRLALYHSIIEAGEHPNRDDVLERMKKKREVPTLVNG